MGWMQNVPGCSATVIPPTHGSTSGHTKLILDIFESLAYSTGAAGHFVVIASGLNSGTRGSII